MSILVARLQMSLVMFYEMSQYISSQIVLTILVAMAMYYDTVIVNGAVHCDNGAIHYDMS